jgi:hypothetical protein
MFVPTVDDYISILVNYSLNLTEITRFDVLFFSENELFTVPIEFGHTTIALHMDVQRLMLLAVKEEREPKESEYFWHISFVLLFLRYKDRNYFRYRVRFR